ncbi:hypothetical protein ACEPAF_1563 [Sanghuangporus sanghuang]
MLVSALEDRGPTAIPKDIPISRNVDETSPDLNVYHHARSGRKVIIGPMPVKAFLDEFLSHAPVGKPMPKPVGAFAKVTRNAKNEKAIYDPLVKAINSGKRCPSVSFCSTADVPEDPSSPNVRPIIRGYAHRGMRLVAQETEGPNLGLAETFFVVKKGHDPFCDSHTHSKSLYKSFFAFENRDYEKEKDVDSGRNEKRNLGECVAYAVEACLRQHRVFYFSVLVIGTRARIFRWDRAGAIVTRAFDYRDHPELLCEFLWRFHLANPVQRGFDPTVSIASQTEEDLFRNLIRKHVALQLGISEDDSEKVDNGLRQHYEKEKVMKVEVYERGRSAPDFYLVSVPLTCPKSVSGHSTRAYWSIKLTGRNEGMCCFLKDTWRLNEDGMKSEGDIYEELGDVGVENICDLERYGDVPEVCLVDELTEERSLCDEVNACSDVVMTLSSPRETSERKSPTGMIDSESATVSSQRTRTQEFIDAAWVCKCLRKNLDTRVFRHTHFRVVLKQAGYSLRTLTGSRELFGAARDALQAIESAYKRCRRVHRDISFDNIILYRSEPLGPRRGLLVDWEFSSMVDLTGKVADDLRSGTWAYMSGNALYDPEGFRHTIDDDLESLFYVVMYGSIRWLPHNYVSRLGRWMHTFFDEVGVDADGQTIGGSKKLLQIAFGGSRFLGLFTFANRFVQDWFKVGYKMLGTTFDASKNGGQTCLWTMEKLQELLAFVCEGLARTDDTKCDRREHEPEDYADTNSGSQCTRISLFAAARNFRESHREPELLGKRSSDEPSEDNDATEHTEMHPAGIRGGKRRRVRPFKKHIGNGSKSLELCLMDPSEAITEPINTDDILPFSLQSGSDDPARYRTPSPSGSLEKRYGRITSQIRTPQHKKVTIAKDNPIAHKCDGLHDSFQANKSEDLASSHEAEGRKVLIGPMPVNEFIDEFLPPATEQMPDPTGAFDNVPASVKDEKDIYDPLTKAINEHARCPSVQFCITADIAEKEKSGRGALKPDVCGYTRKDANRMKRKKRKAKGKKKRHRSNATAVKYESNLGLSELFVEIKRHHDPICEHDSHDEENGKLSKSFFACDNHLDGNNQNPHNDPASAQEERRSFGQNVAYASENCARQHRMFSFSIMVIGTRARFFRWDRAGAIVTEAFDYKEYPELLCEFLWRFHLANPVQRGFDPTVTTASKEEEKLFKKLIREHVGLQLGISGTKSKKLNEGLKQHYEPDKVTKVEVYKRGQSTPDSYLVSVPQKSPLSAAGESTRAYWAVKLQGRNKGVVKFLKDGWRITVDGAAVEGDVYDEMMKEKVDNICDLESYGDVPEFEQQGTDQELSDEADSNDVTQVESDPFTAQATRTDEFIDAGWVCDCLKKDLKMRVVKRIHCRLVLKQAGYPLKTFTGSQELFGAAEDALKALDSAFERCHRIHRDVSLENIILYRDVPSGRRRGLLIDWATSTVTDRPIAPMTYFRTASWAFVSGRILNGNGVELQTREDDMESLFYVVMYASLRWLPHNKVSDLGFWMFNFFDEAERGTDGRERGGKNKLLNQSIAGTTFFEKFWFNDKYIHMWFKAGYNYLKTVHDQLPNSGDWNIDNLKEMTNVAYKGLCKQEGTLNDRVEHRVSDYFIESKAKDVPRGTHTSRSHNVDRGSQRPADKGPTGNAVIAVKRQKDLQGSAGPATKRRRLDPERRQDIFPDAPDDRQDRKSASKESTSRIQHRDPTTPVGPDRIGRARPKTRRQETRGMVPSDHHPGARRSRRLAGMGVGQES